MSSVYHNMINLVLSIAIRGLPSRLVDIAVLESIFFAAAKDISLKPLSLVFPCRLGFPTVGPKIPSLPTFALKSPTKILISDLGHLLYRTSSLS